MLNLSSAKFCDERHDSTIHCMDHVTVVPSCHARPLKLSRLPGQTWPCLNSALPVLCYPLSISWFHCALGRWCCAHSRKDDTPSSLARINAAGTVTCWVWNSNPVSPRNFPRISIVLEYLYHSVPDFLFLQTSSWVFPLACGLTACSTRRTNVVDTSSLSWVVPNITNHEIHEKRDRMDISCKQQLDDGWPESEKDVFQAALSMVVVKNSRWMVGEFYMSYGGVSCEK